jgi:hypothetical protein
MLRDVQDRLERLERCDNENDGLWNTACIKGSNVRISERHINANFNDFIDDNANVGDDEFNNIAVGHGDRFWQPRNR